MKKLKVFMFVALFGAVGFGAFSAYDYYTMSEEERFLLANVEALTIPEPGGGGGIELTICAGLNKKECITPSGAKHTGPLFEGSYN